MARHNHETVLVTGGAGFIGSHLVEALVSQGRKVRVLDDFSRGRASNLAAVGRAVEVVEGDLSNEALLAQVLLGVRTVFHLAAQSAVIPAQQDPVRCYTSNVSGTFNMLKASLSAGVQRFVFTSSREVYGEPASLPVSETAPLNAKNHYGASKIAGEAYCAAFRQCGLSTVVVRLANVYGPRDYGRVIPIFLTKAFEQQDLEVYGGNQIIDFIWIETVVWALQQAAFGIEPPGPINIGSGKGTSLLTVADRIKSLTGSTRPTRVLAARSSEVVGYVADIRRAKDWIGLPVLQDPLERLPRLISTAVGA